MGSAFKKSWLALVLPGISLLDGRIDDQMDGRMGGKIDKWMDGRMQCVYACVYTCTVGWSSALRWVRPKSDGMGLCCPCSWPIKELKRCLQERGVDASQIVEKDELIAKVGRHLSPVRVEQGMRIPLGACVRA